ncbi:hypothetical protein KC19_VG173500 [Ceratodon purpureus]|uniref:Uncharacterized protein n=1 Tax=Ceratodon purpureus TaxID=3225 RepID=A0A8T0HQX5_CERPU|nr:hypothetical protein KC19_VG173500 [Ceratodon purpureus]
MLPKCFFLTLESKPTLWLLLCVRFDFIPSCSFDNCVYLRSVLVSLQQQSVLHPTRELVHF